MRRIQIKIFCMVFINIILITIIPILMMLENYRTTNQLVLQLSKNVFQTQINFSKILNMASVLSLNTQLQGISIHSYILRKQIEKFSNDEFIYNQDYSPLLLNQELVYSNNEDPVKTQIALSNQHHASNWYSYNTLNYNELDGQSINELVRNDRLNYILRSYVHLYLNERNSTINLGYQYFAYNSNGVFFSNYLNTSFSDMVDDPRCPKTKYPFNTKCRFWYLASKASPGMVILPPLLIKSFNKQYEVVNLMCQQVKDRKLQLYSVFCQYLFVEDLRKFFKGYQSIETHQIIFDPYSQIAIYDSRKDLNVTAMNTLKDLLAEKIEASDQLSYFYDQLKANYTNRIIKTQRVIDYASSITSNEFQKQIELKDKNNKTYVIIFNLLYTVDKIDKDVDSDQSAYNSNLKSKYNFLNTYILIDILSEQELMSFSDKILKQMKTVFIVTMVTLGVVSLLVFFLIFIYSLIFAHLIVFPIDHLIQIFEQVNLNLDDINEQIIAQNTQFLDQEDNLQDSFFSQDTRLLYESFTSLVKMLRYSALNLLKEDPSHTLLNLNIQISFFERFQNIHSLGMCHNNLANLHFLQGRYLEALDHYEKSIVYAQIEVNMYKEDGQEQSSVKLSRLSRYLSIYQRLQQKTRQSFLALKKMKENKRNLSISQDIGTIGRKETMTGINRFEKEELFDNLFNRKFNFFKCLNAYYEIQTQEKIKKQQKEQNSLNLENFQSDFFYIEELSTLANELLNISQKLSDYSSGREIIIRMYILEYELLLNREVQADIQYGMIKNLFKKKLIDERETQFSLDQSQRYQSNSIQQDKAETSINKIQLTSPQANQVKVQQTAPNKIDNPTLTTSKNLKINRKQNNIRFSFQQQGQEITLQKKQISCNSSFRKKNNSINQSPRVVINESSLSNQQDIPQIDLDTRNERLQEQDGKYNFDSVLQTQEDNLIFVKKSQDKSQFELSARNSLQSNNNLLAAQSPRITIEDSNIFQFQTPRRSQDPQLNQQIENCLNSFKMRDSCELLSKQINEKLDVSQSIAPRITQILYQDGTDSIRNKNQSMSSKKLQIDQQEPRSKRESSISNLYRQTSLLRKKISYTINSSPATKTTKQISIFSNFSKGYTRQRKPTHIEMKSLAYDLNSDILLSYMAVAQAKILLKQNKLYEATRILTESLETQKYYSHKGKYQVLSLIQKIFHMKNMNSKQLEGILKKFQEQRIFKIAVVVCCSRQKNRELSHWMINEIIQNILSKDQDGLGVINYRYGESHFQQLFKLLRKSYLNLNPMPVSDQLQYIINYDCNPKLSVDILKKAQNILTSTQSDQDDDENEDDEPYCFSNDYRPSFISEFKRNAKDYSQKDELLKDNKQIYKQEQNELCEVENESNCSEELISSYSNSEKKSEIRSSYFNNLFHLCIKNAVNNIFFDKDLQQIEYNRLYLQIQKQFTTSKSLESCTGTSTMGENIDNQICKYIVLVIDLANIDQDEEFKMLCQFLYQLKIKLLILQLNEKECQQEQPRISLDKINGMQIIQQFFTVDKLLKYLHEQRINNKQLQVDYNIEFY